MFDVLKQNKILLIVVGIVVAGLGWYGYAGQGSSNVALSSQVVDGAESAAEREILDTLLELRAINLDGQVFATPAFSTLRDFSTDIISEPIGRRNPFAPFPPETPDSEEGEEE